jgi:hypothetical protein
MIFAGTEVRVRGSWLRIARPEADKYDLPPDPDAVVAELRKSPTRVDLFTFMQVMPDTAPKYAYPMELDNLAVLPVSTFDHWWNQQIRSLPRNRARQAEKRGVTLREVTFDEKLAEGIWEVYNETGVRQGKRNVHFGKDRKQVREEAATFLERSIFIGAFLDDRLIGFAKLVTNAAKTQASFMNIVAMVQHRDKAPTNALIAHAVRSCAERGIPNLVYQSLSYGKKHRDSLAYFKEINGFQQIDLPRYYVPITPFGRAALRLGLHHRFVDYLPAGVASKLRALRSAWYNRKSQTLTEAL